MINHHPLLDIRIAVATTLAEHPPDGTDSWQKTVTDEIIDRLPNFFRQSLQPWTIVHALDADEEFEA